MTPSGITYEGRTGAELGMALGGLGTSTLEIGRDGAFQNIRVQNEWSDPIGPTPAATFLSIHVRDGSGNGVGRVLQLEAPAGLTPVDGLTYTGRFPFAQIAYRDPALPCEVSLEAFSPFVPHAAAASSLPLVFFTFLLHNPGPEPLSVAAAVSWENDIAIEKQRPTGWPTSGNRNSLLAGREPAVLMETAIEELAGSEYLLACLPAEGVDYSTVADWRQGPTGRWLGPNVEAQAGDRLEDWQTFLHSGALPPESDYDDGLGRFSYHKPVAAVTGKTELAPGESRQVRFALAWFFPHHWDRPGSKAKILLGHKYAVRFPGGTRDVADWAFPQRESLEHRSDAWRSLIDESSLPPNCRALMAEIVYLLPRISWWLADGTFVLHESINCPRIQATVLAGYAAPALAALFPELHAQSLRAIAACQLDSGEIPSTLGISSVRHHEYRLFNTGDASVFAIATVWEMLWGGDPDFAADMYPVLKQALYWAERDLDADRDGVPDSHGVDQGWDTFPMHGAAAYIADQWIAALLAGEKVARRFGDDDFADWCSRTRARASETAEDILWNGQYYNLAHNVLTGVTSAICFADQFTYGTVPAGILELGETHPRDRIRRGLEAIWRLNVEPSQFVCRMGSNPDGAPADSSIHEKQRGGASQSNAFTPVSAAPLACAAIQHGMVDQGLALVEEMARVIIHHVGAPWSGLLLFDSQNGKWFYGLHYSDCLILWDVMPALLGVHMDTSQGALTLAPPSVPVKMPVFGKLYSGQVEFSLHSDGVELRLTGLADEARRIRTLTVRLPDARGLGPCTVAQGEARSVRASSAHETILEDVSLPPNRDLLLRWPHASTQ